jgi:PAS domain S-box-containing protein
VREHPQELEVLHHDFLINVTSFFRNPRVFEALKQRIFPRLLKNHKGGEALRFWVVGCSTGQEAYSLAMAYTEFAEKSGVSVPLQIFASDVNPASLDQARAGRYPVSVVDHISSARLRQFFFEDEGCYRVAKPIRDMVVFAHQNMLLDPPFTRVDLISCRNVLIYIEGALQQKIIPTFHYSLKQGGFLLLGSSESASSFPNLFEPVDKNQRIYRKKPASTWLHFERPPAVPGLSKVAGENPGPAIQIPGTLDAQREADRLLLSAYTPASVLIDSNGDTLQFRGQTDRYLHVPSGRACFQLLKMVREGLAPVLEKLMRRARADGRPVLEKEVRFGPRKATIDIEIVPLKNLRARFYLVLFRPVVRRIKTIPIPPVAKGGESHVTARQLAALKDELTEARERFNSLQEEHETSVEELQASNEEVQSSNEELQSLNEELETSNEELESANEELTTLNEELATRNTELRESEQRLREQAQLLEMAPILARSPKDRIIFWSRGAEKMYGFSTEDAVGQAAHLLLNTQFPEPLEKVQSSLFRDGHWEGEVKHRRKDGKVISVATQWVVQHDDQNKVRAILEVNTDITRRIEAESALSQSEQFNRSILLSSPDFISVLDLDGRTIFTNSAPSRDYPDFRACGDRYWPTCWPGSSREPAEAAFRDALAGKISHFDGQAPTPRGAMKWWDVAVGPIPGADQKPAKLLCVARDITEQKSNALANVDRARMGQLRSEIATNASSNGSLQEVLQKSCESLVRHLDLAFARVWTIEENSEELVLKASAGLYTHLDGDHGRIKVGQFKIGRIARSRQPTITNDVCNDSEISNHQWAKRERMVAFAGFPMVVADRVVGVLGVFSRHALIDGPVRELNFTSEALGAVVQRRQTDESLRSTQAKLRDYATNLESKVKERTESLREVISQLEEFSYSVSHDLRAPLRAMQGYAKAIIEDYSRSLDDCGRSYLERIVRNATRMDRLIQDILMYSRLSRQEIPLRPASLDSVVREIIQNRPEMNGVAQITVGDTLPAVVCNEPLLSQAVFNLLSNAIKFVSPGKTPTARLWSERRDGHVRLWIEDNGIGIKPEHQGRLFGVFERIHPDSMYEGTGIGLAIVRKAVERMNGRVGMESDGVSGSRFWIELPAAEKGDS